MTSRDSIADELWLKIGRMANGNCSEGELREIETALLGNFSAQQLFLEYLQLHVDLCIDMHSECAMQQFWDRFPFREGISSSDGHRPLTISSELSSHYAAPATGVADRANHSERAWPWASLAATFLLGILAHFLWDRAIPENGVGPQRVQHDRGFGVPLHNEEIVLARLVSNTGVVRNIGKGRSLEYGDEVHAEDSILLLEGIAELRLRGGVELHIDAPAAITFDNRGVPFLQAGKMIACLPMGQSSFVINTSIGEVRLQRETKAGVFVEGSRVVVQTIEGNALFVPQGFSAPVEFDRLQIGPRTARSFSIKPDGSLRTGTRNYSPDIFTSRFTLASDLLDIPPEYVSLVRSSRPLGYWRFEAVEDGLVRNEVSLKHACLVRGKVSIVSQGGDNHVAEFGLGLDAGSLLALDRFGDLQGKDYSFEVWVKPSHHHWGNIVTLCRPLDRYRDVNEAQAFFLQATGIRRMQREMGKGNVFRSVHRSPPEAQPQFGTTCFSPSPYEIRSWQHVVATKSRNEFQLYVNGELVDSQPDNTQIDGEYALLIGQEYTFDASNPFVGQLDEISVYDYALSKEEVGERFRLIDRYSTARPEKNKSKIRD